jgi:hypothetical protein
MMWDMAGSNQDETLMNPLETTIPEDRCSSPQGAFSEFPAGSQVAGRFRVNGVLGRGSSGEVLSVQELSLDREIAMKVLRGAGGPAIARFMREARITAKLDHPGVPPVYALEFLPDGGLLFTMRRLTGLTLGEAIRRAGVGQAPAAIASVNAVVSLGLRVCEALVRAHFLGIIHRDVKPDNIMLGDHGEVALVDWGECRLKGETDESAGSAVGTPAYMSPEQARGEGADERSDVYSLAATLYHVLTRCCPTWDEEPDRFWDKKRQGVIDPLPTDAIGRVPRPLLAILRRALAANSGERYDSVAALAADLEHFQAGLAVVAYRESLPERVWRGCRRHRRAILAASAVLAACLVAGGVLWRDHLRQLAEWGPPVLTEDFADDGWRKRWLPETQGQWSVEDGRLIANGPRQSLLTLDRSLSGAVAIEYDGEILVGNQPGDLSVIWSEDPAVAAGRAPEGKVREFWLQAGAFDDYFCAVYRQPDGARLDKRPFQLKAGRKHHFRVELDGTSLIMLIDGRQVLSVTERLPIATGRLCFYAYYPGKAFSNVRVYQKRLPQVVSAMSIGDAFWRQGLQSQAATAYQDLAESQPGTALAVEAVYRQGLALAESGHAEAAQAVWQRLPPGEQADRVAGHYLEQDAAAGRYEQVCASLSTLYRNSPLVRNQLRAQWQTWAVRGIGSGLGHRDPRAATALVEVKLRLFPDHLGSDLECGLLLNALGRTQEVVDRFPDEVTPCAVALIRLGRGEEVLSRFPDALDMVRTARIALGRFDEVYSDRRMNHDVLLRCVAGRLNVLSDGTELDPVVLLWHGRADLALATSRAPAHRGEALAALGRWSEAIEPGNSGLSELKYLDGRIDPLQGGDHPNVPNPGWRLVKLSAAGESSLRDALASRLDANWPDWNEWIAHLVISPIVRGDSSQLRRRLEIGWKDGRQGGGQRPYYLAGVALGRLEATAFESAPCAGEAVLWRTVARAIQMELAGDQAAIRSAWQAYLDLPWHKRFTDRCLPNSSLEALANWRTMPSLVP